MRSLTGEAVAVHAVENTLDKPLAILEDADARAETAPPAVRARLAAVVEGARGLLLQRSGRLADAMAAFDRVLADPGVLHGRDLATVLLNRGATAIELGRLDAALAGLRRLPRGGGAFGHALDRVPRPAQHRFRALRAR